MAKREEVLESGRTTRPARRRLGLVVHPTRDIHGPLGELRRWAGRHDAQLVQVSASCQQQRVADRGDTEDCDLLARLAGDGCIVSTPIGSSAYALAAGGPLLAPDLEALLVTPLPTHGGSCPPFVVGSRSVIRLVATPGLGGARLELDGQVSDALEGSLA